MSRSFNAKKKKAVSLCDTCSESHEKVGNFFYCHAGREKLATTGKIECEYYKRNWKKAGIFFIVKENNKHFIISSLAGFFVAIISFFIGLILGGR